MSETGEDDLERSVSRPACKSPHCTPPEYGATKFPERSDIEFIGESSPMRRGSSAESSANISVSGDCGISRSVGTSETVELLGLSFALDPDVDVRGTCAEFSSRPCFTCSRVRGHSTFCRSLIMVVSPETVPVHRLQEVFPFDDGRREGTLQNSVFTTRNQCDDTSNTPNGLHEPARKTHPPY
jgi:hypothetical protein